MALYRLFSWSCFSFKIEIRGKFLQMLFFQVLHWDQLKAVLLFSMPTPKTPRTISRSNVTDLMELPMVSRISTLSTTSHFTPFMGLWPQWDLMGAFRFGIKTPVQNLKPLSRWSSQLQAALSTAMAR